MRSFAGAAISLLDSVFLPLWLPKQTIFQTIGYGLPRVGNKAFANYVDANLDLTHINNREDPVPTVPFEFLGFVHPSGEVHIEDSGEWAACPGKSSYYYFVLGFQLLPTRVESENRPGQSEHAVHRWRRAKYP
jgi:hypothetical protein